MHFTIIQAETCDKVKIIIIIIIIIFNNIYFVVKTGNICWYNKQQKALYF